MCKVIIERKGSAGQTCEPSQEVKVRPAEMVFWTPHPLRRIRPDSPNVDARNCLSRREVGRLCERISESEKEKEEEEEMSDSENNPPEGGDGDYEGSDSVFDGECEYEAEETR